MNKKSQYFILAMILLAIGSLGNLYANSDTFAMTYVQTCHSSGSESVCISKSESDPSKCIYQEKETCLTGNMDLIRHGGYWYGTFEDTNGSKYPMYGACLCPKTPGTQLYGEHIGGSPSWKKNADGSYSVNKKGRRVIDSLECGNYRAGNCPNSKTGVVTSEQTVYKERACDNTCNFDLSEAEMAVVIAEAQAEAIANAPETIWVSQDIPENATEVMICASADFTGCVWSPPMPTIAVVMETGESNVYVAFKDNAGNEFGNLTKTKEEAENQVVIAVTPPENATHMQVCPNDSFSGAGCETIPVDSTVQYVPDDPDAQVFIKYSGESIAAEDTAVVTYNGADLQQPAVVSVNVPNGAEKMLVCTNEDFTGCAWQDPKWSVQLTFPSGVEMVYVKFKLENAVETQAVSYNKGELPGINMAERPLKGVVYDNDKRAIDSICLNPMQYNTSLTGIDGTKSPDGAMSFSPSGAVESRRKTCYADGCYSRKENSQTKYLDKQGNPVTQAVVDGMEPAAVINDLVSFEVMGEPTKMEWKYNFSFIGYTGDVFHYSDGATTLDVEGINLVDDKKQFTLEEFKARGYHLVQAEEVPDDVCTANEAGFYTVHFDIPPNTILMRIHSEENMEGIPWGPPVYTKEIPFADKDKPIYFQTQVAEVDGPVMVIIPSLHNQAVGAMGMTIHEPPNNLEWNLGCDAYIGCQEKPVFSCLDTIYSFGVKIDTVEGVKVVKNPINGSIELEYSLAGEDKIALMDELGLFKIRVPGKKDGQTFKLKRLVLKDSAEGTYPIKINLDKQDLKIVHPPNFTMTDKAFDRIVLDTNSNYIPVTFHNESGICEYADYRFNNDRTIDCARSGTMQLVASEQFKEGEAGFVIGDPKPLYLELDTKTKNIPIGTLCDDNQKGEGEMHIEECFQNFNFKELYCGVVMECFSDNNTTDGVCKYRDQAKNDFGCAAYCADHHCGINFDQDDDAGEE